MPYDKTPLTAPVNLIYWQEGSGTPLLLLHGFPFDHTIWEQQANDLKSIGRIIMPDLRGHGKSPAPEGAYSMDVMAQDVIMLLNRIGVYKAIWVGHSMGGYVTLAAWQLAPERFSGIGLIASNYLADSPEAQQRRYDLAEKVSKEGAEAAINPKVFKEGIPPDAPQVQMINKIIHSTPPAGIIGTLQGMATRPDSTETLKSIRVPALVIGGEHDQLFKPEIPQTMADLIPGAQLMMPDSGHMPMLEQPDVVTQGLESLVSWVEKG
jgi:pimeloyl-ACP methyl ester carboxylesterase